MPKNAALSQELEELDRFYRAGGLQRMASPHIHYCDSKCPHVACTWWDGTGFAGRCPGCNGWIHFTSLRMDALTEEQASHLPQLPDDWHAVAMFA